jgi:hypothetical protein
MTEKAALGRMRGRLHRVIRSVNTFIGGRLPYYYEKPGERPGETYVFHSPGIPYQIARLFGLRPVRAAVALLDRLTQDREYPASEGFSGAMSDQAEGKGGYMSEKSDRRKAVRMLKKESDKACEASVAKDPFYDAMEVSL